MKTVLCVDTWVDIVFAMAVLSAQNSDISSYKCLGMLQIISLCSELQCKDRSAFVFIL